MFNNQKKFSHMKHLKKLSALFFVLLAVAMVATSCKKDDNDGKHNSDLVGTWVYEKYESYTWGGGYSYQEIFEFKSNGSGTYSKADNYDSDSESFKWSSTKNTITIKWEDDDPGTYNYSLSSDGKALTLWDPEDGEEEEDGRTYYKQ